MCISSAATIIIVYKTKEIEEPIYDFISNSVFALSLIKEDGNVLDLDASDNPDYYVCKNECRFS